MVAVYLGGAWSVAANNTTTLPQLQAMIATASVPASSTPAVNTTPPVPVAVAMPAQPAAPVLASSGGLSLAAIGQNLQSTISSAGDPAISGTGASAMATPYVFNYYLMLPAVSGGKISTAPDVNVVFPNVNTSNPMPFSQYWAGMMSYLQSQGMSGLRGLGYQRSPYFSRQMGGWLA